MYQLCRHIMSSNSTCGCPAIKNTLFCHHHTEQKKLTPRRRRSPCDFTLPFVFPEDRAAIQTNHFLVMQALNEGRIDQRTANAYTSMLRACRINLGKEPLLDSSPENVVQRVILTPEGEEIAPPREMLEEGEAAPTHGPECPCARCAEQHRNAAPEQHHANCQCGLCEAPITHPDGVILSEAPAGRGVEEPAVSQPSNDVIPSEVEGLPHNGVILSEATEGSEVEGPAVSPSSHKNRRAAKLHIHEPLPPPRKNNGPCNDYESVRRKYAAWQDAVAAGQNPPIDQRYDLSNYESEGMKRYKAKMEEIEKNKQIAEEIWQRRFAGKEAEQRGVDEAQRATA